MKKKLTPLHGMRDQRAIGDDNKQSSNLQILIQLTARNPRKRSDRNASKIES